MSEIHSWRASLAAFSGKTSRETRQFKERASPQISAPFDREKSTTSTRHGELSKLWRRQGSTIDNPVHSVHTNQPNVPRPTSWFRKMICTRCFAHQCQCVLMWTNSWWSEYANLDLFCPTGTSRRYSDFNVIQISITVFMLTPLDRQTVV